MTWSVDQRHTSAPSGAMHDKVRWRASTEHHADLLLPRISQRELERNRRASGRFGWRIQLQNQRIGLCWCDR